MDLNCFSSSRSNAFFHGSLPLSLDLCVDVHSEHPNPVVPRDKPKRLLSTDDCTDDLELHDVKPLVVQMTVQMIWS